MLPFVSPFKPPFHPHVFTLRFSYVNMHCHKHPLAHFHYGIQMNHVCCLTLFPQLQWLSVWFFSFLFYISFKTFSFPPCFLYSILACCIGYRYITLQLVAITFCSIQNIVIYLSALSVHPSHSLYTLSHRFCVALHF